MNRRSLYSGMRVAYVPSKHSTPVRAIVSRVDRSEGYGATHAVVLCDDNWSQRTNADGSAMTKTVTSRQIKDWNTVEAGVEEAQFEAARRQIQQQLVNEQRAKEAEPWEQLGNLLGLLVGEHTQVQGYGSQFYRITVPKAEWPAFLDLLVPHLTQRLFEKSFGPTPGSDDTSALDDS